MLSCASKYTENKHSMYAFDGKQIGRCKNLLVNGKLLREIKSVNGAVKRNQWLCLDLEQRNKRVEVLVNELLSN